MGPYAQMEVVESMNSFSMPAFDDGDLELRYDNGQVCIYGTSAGLRKLAQLCLKLANQVEERDSIHLHLEDYYFLTGRSLVGTVGAFQPRQRSRKSTGG